MDNLNLSELPSEFTAGTTISYWKSFSSYPSPTWTFEVSLGGASILTVAGVAENGGFRVTLSATQTGELLPGTYRWSERVKNSGNVLEVASGQVVVNPNLAEASEGSLQTWAEKTLALVELAIANRLPAAAESYQVAGRALSKTPLADLIKLRAYLKTLVAQEQNPGSFSKPVVFSFPPVSG